MYRRPNCKSRPLPVNFFFSTFQFNLLSLQIFQKNKFGILFLPDIAMKNIHKSLVLTFVILFGFTGFHTGVKAQYAGLDTLQLKTIFDEPFLAGVRPNLFSFSPDGSQVYFSWNDSSYASNSSLYEVDITGENLQPSPDNDLIRSVLSPEHERIAYSSRGDIFVADTDGENERQIFSGVSNTRNLVWSPDGGQLAFNYNGNIWTIDIESGGTRQITRKTDDDPDFTILAWAMNGEKMVVSQTDRSGFWEVYFPRYVPKMVEPGRTMRGQPHIELQVIDVESREMTSILEGDFYLLNNDLSADGRYFVVDYTDHPMKNRHIVMYDFQEDTSWPIHSETTEGWIYRPLLRVRFAPEGDLLMYTSEESGWSHIYTVRPDGSRMNRLTAGSHEVVWAEWIDGSNIVFASTERDSGLRDIYTVNANTFSASRLTRTDGYRTSFRLSPDRRYVAFESTFWNQPSDIYLLDIRRPRNELRLTHSIPERFKDIEWQIPEYIRFTSRDEETRLTMDVLKPHDFDPSQKYPVVVFVHGAGSLQNVFQGWSLSYHREYMFHQILNRHGYVVVEVDYRHSTGYGRKFREDVTNWMGKYELEDIVDGLDYLDRQHGYVDLENVGLYGGSYGGFMALYALSNAPDYFKAGAALRAVTNWENYYYANPGYTRPRLGTPDENPENYERSSPISYADSLSRPALILHGLIDDNVGFQDAAQYIDRLIKSGNTNFDMMMYPSERHAYTNPNSWYDQYLRIFNFFEKHLKEDS